MSLKTEPHSLTKAIRALDTQLGSDIGEPVPMTSHVWLIVGGRGSGKTTTALNVLDTRRGEYDLIFLVSKTAKSDSKSKKMLAELLEELDEDNQFATTLDEETATDIIERIQQFNAAYDGKRKGGPRHLVVLDDQLSNIRQGQRSVVNDLVVNSRHLRMSLWVLTQQLRSVPPLWRANAQLISIWPTASTKEHKALFEELDNIPEAQLKQYLSFAHQADGKGKPFLHINVFDAANPRLFKRFDLIVHAGGPPTTPATPGSAPPSR